MALVVDASVAVGWIARTQATPLTSAALSLVAREFGAVPSYFAIRTTLPLATRDVSLARAAEATGVTLFKS